VLLRELAEAMEKADATTVADLPRETCIDCARRLARLLPIAPYLAATER
jgi:hypothetical protein